MVERSNVTDMPIAVKPTHTHARTNVATVCWLKDLLQSNRGRLYDDVTSALVSTMKDAAKDAQKPPARVPARVHFKASVSNKEEIKNISVSISLGALIIHLLCAGDSYCWRRTLRMARISGNGGLAILISMSKVTWTAASVDSECVQGGVVIFICSDIYMVLMELLLYIYIYLSLFCKYHLTHSKCTLHRMSWNMQQYIYNYIYSYLLFLCWFFNLNVNIFEYYISSPF